MFTGSDKTTKNLTSVGFLYLIIMIFFFSIHPSCLPWASFMVVIGTSKAFFSIAFDVWLRLTKKFECYLVHLLSREARVSAILQGWNEEMLGMMNLVKFVCFCPFNCSTINVDKCMKFINFSKMLL
jgi:hypothetical protein